MRTKTKVYSTPQDTAQLLRRAAAVSSLDAKHKQILLGTRALLHGAPSGISSGRWKATTRKRRSKLQLDTAQSAKPFVHVLRTNKRPPASAKKHPSTTRLLAVEQPRAQSPSLGVAQAVGLGLPLLEALIAPLEPAGRVEGCLDSLCRRMAVPAAYIRTRKKSVGGGLV